MKIKDVESFDLAARSRISIYRLESSRSRRILNVIELQLRPPRWSSGEYYSSYTTRIEQVNVILVTNEMCS